MVKAIKGYSVMDAARAEQHFFAALAATPPVPQKLLHAMARDAITAYSRAGRSDLGPVETAEKCLAIFRLAPDESSRSKLAELAAFAHLDCVLDATGAVCHPVYDQFASGPFRGDRKPTAEIDCALWAKAMRWAAIAIAMDAVHSCLLEYAENVLFTNCEDVIVAALEAGTITQGSADAFRGPTLDPVRQAQLRMLVLDWISPEGFNAISPQTRNSLLQSSGEIKTFLPTWMLERLVDSLNASRLNVLRADMPPGIDPLGVPRRPEPVLELIADYAACGDTAT